MQLAIFLADVPIRAWVKFSWSLFEWITTPLFVVGPLLCLVALPLFLKDRRWRTWVGRPAAILLGIYLLFVSPLMARALTWGFDNRFVNQWYEARTDQSKPIDAIVILGRGYQMTSSRVDVVAKLDQSQAVPLIFASGLNDAPDILYYLKEAGIPAEKLKGEDCSRTTEENAEYTAALLHPQGVRRILLVTDAPHMPRSMFTFESYGFEVVAQPTRLPWDYGSVEKSFLALREYIGLAGYASRGRFDPRESTISDTLLKKIESPQCRINAPTQLAKR
jgi:uncharacterized SAM-binding protein YcdF (DUF218 family)